MEDEELYYLLCLNMVRHIGPINAKNLIAYCGSAKSVFTKSQKKLQKIPGLGPKLSLAIQSFRDFKKAENELEFCKKTHVRILRYYDEDYPQRLKRVADAPLLLFFRGNANLNHSRMVNIVGTRKCSEYGKEVVKQLVRGLRGYNCHVVSGLAYGIDICAHKACVKLDVENIGVVAHGLDRLYPSIHRSTVAEMEKCGGVLSQFNTGTTPDRENFPSRNRIVAGMCDATIVVESAIKGGAMITADIAFSYNRDVFAVPGRVGDVHSEGTHHLIKTQKAILLESADDLALNMGWEAEAQKLQTILPLELTHTEQALLALFESRKSWNIDSLNFEANISSSNIALNLLELEMKGLIRSLPGNRYEKT